MIQRLRAVILASSPLLLLLAGIRVPGCAAVETAEDIHTDPPPLSYTPPLPFPPARVPYLSDHDFLAKSPHVAADILKRRHGHLLNLDRVLMHSPPVAEGWNTMIGALRSSLSSIDGRLRELVMLRVAVVNQAYYEWYQHVPVFIAEGGTPREAMSLGRWRQAEGVFSDRDRAVLAYVDEMTLQVHVQDRTVEALRAVLQSDQQVVEVTTVAAAYNMVSRLLEALKVAPEATDPADLPPMPLP